MALVTSKSTTWPRATAPTVESTGPSIAGCVLALTVLSSHAQLVTEWMRPPATLWECDTFDTCSRRRADVTWRAPTPLTRTRKNACLTGLPSTSSRALGRLLLAGVAAFTMASASTTPTAARADGGQMQSARQAPGHETLSAPSHCSLAWSTTLSPQRGAAAVGAAAVGAAAVGAAAVGAAAVGAAAVGAAAVGAAAVGAGGQVQSARQRPRHRALSAPSHCSLAWFTFLSPHTGQAKCGVPSTPTQEPASPDAGSSTRVSVAFPVPSSVTCAASPGWPFGMKSCGWSKGALSKRTRSSVSVFRKATTFALRSGFPTRRPTPSILASRLAALASWKSPPRV